MQRQTDKVDVALQETGSERPAFMEVLGLLPPYEAADVKAAYRAKALLAHPDRGGDPADFNRLKDAYDQALEFVAFSGSRREWIAARVEPYLLQEEVVAEVIKRGGRVQVERIPWMEKSCGEDFAHLAERLRRIKLHHVADGDNFLKFLADHKAHFLVELDLTGSRITSQGLNHLSSFDVLRSLNLSGTGADARSLRKLLPCLPSLEWLNVRGTKLGWWNRFLLRRAFSHISIVTDPTPAVVPGSETVDHS
ncbi:MULTISPECIES: hypothetical protein [unclassified Schlesneria]|uniref:hypothetical protein n=1 Tax=unclassified Schlesneria TaxID=2762017 RepID=UPI002F072F29